MTTEKTFKASNGVTTIDDTWNWVPGYEGRYQCSKNGEVRSLLRGKTLTMKQYTHRDGHMMIRLRKNSQPKTHYVHRLVLMTFVGMPKPGQVARHLNDIPSDNRLENLAWGTPRDNSQDALQNGRNWQANKTNCPSGHLLALPNLVPSKPNGNRECLACSRANHLHVSERKERADALFRAIMSGEYELMKDRCGHGHPLGGDNVIPSSAKTGRRSCLACHRARSRAKSARINFTKDLADAYYHAIATGDTSLIPQSIKTRDPKTGRFVTPDGTPADD